MSDFIVPDFIKNASVDKINQSMRQNLPKVYDTSEGSHIWNLLFAFAWELSYHMQHDVLETLKLVSPKYAYGKYLDYHAESLMGFEGRKSGTFATGYISIEAEPGTVIPEGYRFSTATFKEDETAKKYETTAEYEVDNTGNAKIPIAAIEKGTIGNTAANTIIINAGKLEKIKSVTNEDEIINGVDVEIDETLAARIDEYERTREYSHIGNLDDYRRWAKEVTGIEEAAVIDPMNNSSVDDDSGIVTIIVTGTDGSQVDEAKRAEVYNYIMDPNPLSTDGTPPDTFETGAARLAPINAKIIVKSPTPYVLNITATIFYDGTQADETVFNTFIKSVQNYLVEAMNDKVIKYSKIGRYLSETMGVSDYTGLVIGNGEQMGTENISIQSDVLPVVNAESVKFIKAGD